MNKEAEASPKLERYVLFIYLLGCGFWLIVWYLVRGYELMSHTLLLWLPFLVRLFLLNSNIQQDKRLI